MFDILNDVKVYAVEALLKYEAGFPDCKEGQHIRLVIVRGKYGFNCKYFLNTLVGTYFAILPPYGGTRPFDVYNGNKKLLEHEILQGKIALCSHESGHKIWSDLHSPSAMHFCKEFLVG